MMYDLKVFTMELKHLRENGECSLCAECFPCYENIEQILENILHHPKVRLRILLKG